MSKRKGERRLDRYGEFREMARAEGHVMFRRPGAAPHCMSVKEWENLPLVEDNVVRLTEQQRKETI